MGSIIIGNGLSSTYVGRCKEGKIYCGRGLNEHIIGEYRDGDVFLGTGFLGSKPIGFYKDNTVYRGTTLFNSTAIGEYKDGKILRGTGLNTSIIGRCDGGVTEAAAYLLLEDEFQDVFSSADSALPGSDSANTKHHTKTDFGSSLSTVAII